MASALPSTNQPRRATAWPVVALAALAGLFLVGHAIALPNTLGDIDSINFALGVERFDVSEHRPHPPGYPVYIAAGRLSTAVVGALAPSWDRDRRASTGLAIWGVVAGTLAVFVLAAFWRAAGLSPPLSALAAIVVVVCPLFWFTAARPLSDIPGLVAAILVQTAFVQGMRLRATGIRRSPRLWLWASFGTGLLIGYRSQALWLTAPFFAWCVGDLFVRRQRREAAHNLGAAAAGVLLWAVPLIWVSGFRSYLDAVLFQGRDDLTGINLLSTRPSGDLLRHALDYTFVRPWQTQLLGGLVLLLALIGAVRLARKAPSVLAVIVVGFLPYLAFHLAFHETVTLRYALPLVVPIAGLAIVGLSVAGLRAAAVGVAAIAVAGVIVAQPRIQVYAAGGAPVFPAFQAMHHALPEEPRTPVLRMHHQVWWGVRRAIEWYRPGWPGDVPPHPGDREWLGVVQHWTSGRTEPVWFLSELTRTDLAAFDPRATHFGGRYELPGMVRELVGGARLDSMIWWRLEQPFWMIGRGWSLTPEIAGVTNLDGAAPSERPAEAHLRRDPRPVRVMIGGRYLAARGQPRAIVYVDLDGQPIAEWTTSAETPWFVQWIDLPAGVPAGQTPYAKLRVRVESASPDHAPPAVGLEQFDAAREGEVMFAYDEDWHELESEPSTGLMWRWTSARSTIDVRGAAENLSLLLAGLSPRRDFDRAPTVVVRAGDRELARFTPDRDFSERVPLPADALAAAGGRVTIETDATFAPAERGQSADERRLGLRITKVEIAR